MWTSLQLKKKIKHSKICALDSTQSSTSIEMLVNQQKGFKITYHSLKYTTMNTQLKYWFRDPHILTFHSH